MIGKSLVTSFMPGIVFGLVYLLLIMWWATGHTPLNVIEAVTDIINQPLQQVAEALGH